MDDWRYRLRAIVRREAIERDLDDELRLHLQLETEKNVKAGLGRQEAARQARLSLGARTLIKEECRDTRGISLLETGLQDLRYAVRALRKSPGFTIPSVA